MMYPILLVGAMNGGNEHLSPKEFPYNLMPLLLITEGISNLVLKNMSVQFSLFLFSEGCLNMTDPSSKEHREKGWNKAFLNFD